MLGAIGGCLSLPASVSPLGRCNCADERDRVGVCSTGHQPSGAACAEGGDWHQLLATRRPRAAPVPPPHLCQRAGHPPPGPGGSRASKERGGSGLGQCGCPVAVTLCTSSSGTLQHSQARAPQGGPHEGPGWVPHRGFMGPSCSSARPSWEEGMAQLTRAGGRWPSFWNSHGTCMGLWSSRGCGREPTRAGHTHLLGVPG